MTTYPARCLTGLLVFTCLSLVPGLLPAQAPKPLRQQLLYVPIYSEIPYGDQHRTLNLSATLSIRNTDRTQSLTLKRVDYYNSKGNLASAYLTEPCILKPMASLEFIVKESDRRGGISASFLVEWTGASPLSPPVVEAIMISTASAQGISFSSPARVLEEKE